MKTEFADELLAICRYFGVFERDAVCCGTVTVQQCMVLQSLLGGGRDNNELAAFAGVSPGAMTRLVDGLAKHGWVRRHRSDEDRRRVTVELTARGQREAARLRGLTEQTVEAVMHHIPRAKQRQVLESLQLLRAALERSSDAVAACCAPQLLAKSGD